MEIVDVNVLVGKGVLVNCWKFVDNVVVVCFFVSESNYSFSVVCIGVV